MIDDGFVQAQCVVCGFVFSRKVCENTNMQTAERETRRYP